ncbi:MAG: Wzz/FepE/Etk N-terminal domain-containing protein [Bacteroidota bacterium]
MSDESTNNEELNMPQQRPEDFPFQEYRLVPVEEREEVQDRDPALNLIELFRYIWLKRDIIYKFTVAGIILGLAIAFLSPKEYESGATLVPESQNTDNGAGRLLQQYGGLLGFNGGSSHKGGVLSPMLYPQIVQSLPFQLELLNTEVEFTRFGTTTNVYTFFDEVYTPSLFYYVKGYTIGLPGKIIGLLKEKADPRPLPHGFVVDSVISVTKKQQDIIEEISERVSVSLSQETGVINLKVTMPDPNAAAQLAKTSIEVMREYVTSYRTRKAEENLRYARQQMDMAKKEFQDVQERLAEFRDRNVNLSSARAETQLQRLQSEYDLAFNVYKTVAQQVEEAKLRLQEETPVVSVMQPVQVPVKESKPKKKLIVITTTFLGIFISTCYLIALFIREKVI